VGVTLEMQRAQRKQGSTAKSVAVPRQEIGVPGAGKRLQRYAASNHLSNRGLLEIRLQDTFG
jgi:hypothetical protein